MSTDENSDKVEVDKLMDELAVLSNAFTKAMDELKEEQEKFWNSLSTDDQIKAFCAVARRIHDGELVQRGSYRYVLYNVFGFGPEAYAQAQCAGYLDIHNALFSYEEFCESEKKALNAENKLSQIKKILEG